MANSIIGANQITQEALNGDDFLFVLDTGSITTAGNTAAVVMNTSGNNVAQIDGAVSSEDAPGVFVANPSINSALGIGAGGTVVTGAPTLAAIEIQAAGFGLTNAGLITGAGALNVNALAASFTLANSGVIQSNQLDAISVFGNNATISNTGRIVGAIEAIELQADNGDITNSGEIIGGDEAIAVNGTNADIANSGDILADNTAIEVGFVDTTEMFTLTNTGTVSGATAIAIGRGEDHVIQNSGTIAGAAYALFATADPNAQTPGASVTFDNLGEVMGFMLFGSFSDTLFNAGSISGTIVMGAATDELLNSGLIDGDVELGGGDDTFDGRGGTVTGYVFGGKGNDTYIIDDGGIVLLEAATGGVDEVRSSVSYALETNFETLTLLGAGDIDGTGTDFQNVITGNAGDNALFGNNSRDTIDGGAGNDAVDGGVGSDVLYGGAQDDWVAGRSGGDYLDGGEGDDYLFGGIGDDSMFGGEGNDTLKGGLGEDTMDGGDGQDVFVFTRVSDSIGGTSDIIENFVTGEDRLDFTGLVSGTLDVNILGGLTGGGQASLRTFENSFGDTIVFVDADGDGSSDMRIEVNMVTGLTESDFLV